MFNSLIARWRLRRLIRRWESYRDLVRAGGLSTQATAEQERALLTLQARLAGDLGWLGRMLPPNRPPDTAQRLAGLQGLLARTSKKTATPSDDPTMLADFERAWHDGYLFLNQITGLKLQTKAATTARHPRAVPTGMPFARRRFHLPVVNWVGRLLGFALRVAILALAVYLVGKALGVRWSEGGKLVIQREPGVTASASVVGGLQSLWHGIVNFMQPVTTAYGTEVTIAMVGVLVLAVGYFAFIRS